MAFKRTTRWKNDKENNFENNIQNLVDFNSIIDDQNKDNKTYHQNFEVVKIFDENQKISLADEETLFNTFIVKYEKVRSGTEPIEERTDKQSLELMAYNNRGTTKFIINKNTDAMFFIRKLLKYKGQKEISNLNIELENDFFLWLLYKIYKKDNIFSVKYENEEKELTLRNIKFFKGTSLDNNSVTSKGNTVLNLISTLSFVLEKGKIDQLVLCVKYHNHENIEIRLQTDGLIGIEDLNKYDGVYENESVSLQQSKLILLIYNEIIPNLLEYYRNDIQNKKWEHQIKADFLEEIKNDITNRIDQMKNKI
ncbi:MULTISPECIES: hypothetical protein [Staphylococcus]|uniref:hypothetical protein n=1 Tax=Staphylococcus TaxID=1279 RepID=UPI00069E6D63|nr:MULTISPECIES: hypothetical protein [Staphylococcus]MCH4383005.1 hypothetical protein [Staphylococcus haemolyticus]MCH4533528.1 hypothetical protein [Staphylococcus haemolyticus]OFP04569.1 hypothetical protein HMPREF3003_11845 [Staphylococcus sp. HMSC078B01]